MTAEHPEWDVRVFDAQEDVPPVLNSYLANGMSIFSKSRNPERALMALDYLRNDAEINNLFCYGIEGKHWEASASTAWCLFRTARITPMTATATGACETMRTGALWREAFPTLKR